MMANGNGVREFVTQARASVWLEIGLAGLAARDDGHRMNDGAPSPLAPVGGRLISWPTRVMQAASRLGLVPEGCRVKFWCGAIGEERRRAKFRVSFRRWRSSLGWRQNRIMSVLRSISDIRCEVPKLKGDNFKLWNERVLLQLGCIDIDYAIRKYETLKIIDTSTPDQILLYECWDKSNHLSVMYIKTKISVGIRGSIKQHKNVRESLKAIDKQFVTSDKALESTLKMKFTSLKLIGIIGVHEHIMEMRDIVAQMKKLEVEMSKSFLVHFILNTLPPQYGPFKISYNTHKDKWYINELMTMCVQEEERLMMEQGESVMLGIQNLRKLVSSEQFILSENKMGSHVEAIGTYDFSRYMYLYILHNKNEALDDFKVFNAEVEKQCGKQIKIVRSNRGGEYYGRYMEDGQALGPFAKFLQENGIVAQYTMPGSLDQNGVAERRNQTLLDMMEYAEQLKTY
ncbi:hypothetical protein AAG906_005864 [Vitis piasezkii]